MVVEIIVGSVSILAMLALIFNLRKLGAGGDERIPLDGNPHWADVTVVTVEPRGEYLGFDVVRVEVRWEMRSETLVGLVPPSVTSLAAGMTLQGHVEFDMLDSLRLPGAETTPREVVAAALALLGAEADARYDEWGQLHFTCDGSEVQLWMAEDGWLTIVFDSELEIAEGVEIDLRAPAHGPLAPMLAENLGMSGEPNGASIEIARQLSVGTLAQLGRFAASAECWICIEPEVIEFECPLLFADAEVVASLVREAVAMVRAIEADLGGSSAGDGVW